MNLILLSLLGFGCAIGLSAHAAGGIVGGGGNAFTQQDPFLPAPIASVHAEVENAVDRLVPYLRIKRGQAQSDPGMSPLWQKLFAKPEEVFAVLAVEKFEMLDDAACFDRNGTAYDGSTLTGSSNTICISIQRLARRIAPSEIRRQSFALLIHEISEVLGFSDDEAVDLQIEVLKSDLD